MSFAAANSNPMTSLQTRNFATATALDGLKQSLDQAAALLERAKLREQTTSHSLLRSRLPSVVSAAGQDTSTVVPVIQAQRDGKATITSTILEDSLRQFREETLRISAQNFDFIKASTGYNDSDTSGQASSPDDPAPQPQASVALNPTRSGKDDAPAPLAASGTEDSGNRVGSPRLPKFTSPKLPSASMSQPGDNEAGWSKEVEDSAAVLSKTAAEELLRPPDDALSKSPNRGRGDRDAPAKKGVMDTNPITNAVINMPPLDTNLAILETWREKSHKVYQKLYQLQWSEASEQSDAAHKLAFKQISQLQELVEQQADWQISRVRKMQALMLKERDEHLSISRQVPPRPESLVAAPHPLADDGLAPLASQPDSTPRSQVTRELRESVSELKPNLPLPADYLNAEQQTEMSNDPLLKIDAAYGKLATSVLADGIGAALQELESVWSKMDTAPIVMPISGEPVFAPNAASSREAVGGLAVEPGATNPTANPGAELQKAEFDYRAITEALQELSRTSVRLVTEKSQRVPNRLKVLEDPFLAATDDGWDHAHWRDTSFSKIVDRNGREFTAGKLFRDSAKRRASLDHRKALKERQERLAVSKAYSLSDSNAGHNLATPSPPLRRRAHGKENSAPGIPARLPRHAKDSKTVARSPRHAKESKTVETPRKPPMTHPFISEPAVSSADLLVSNLPIAYQKLARQPVPVTSRARIPSPQKNADPPGIRKLSTLEFDEASQTPRPSKQQATQFETFEAQILDNLARPQQVRNTQAAGTQSSPPRVAEAQTTTSPGPTPPKPASPLGSTALRYPSTEELKQAMRSIVRQELEKRNPVSLLSQESTFEERLAQWVQAEVLVLKTPQPMAAPATPPPPAQPRLRDAGIQAEVQVSGYAPSPPGRPSPPVVARQMRPSRQAADVAMRTAESLIDAVMGPEVRQIVAHCVQEATTYTTQPPNQQMDITTTGTTTGAAQEAAIISELRLLRQGLKAKGHHTGETTIQQPDVMWMARHEERLRAMEERLRAQILHNAVPASPYRHQMRDPPFTAPQRDADDEIMYQQRLADLIREAAEVQARRDQHLTIDVSAIRPSAQNVTVDETFEELDMPSHEMFEDNEARHRADIARQEVLRLQEEPEDEKSRIRKLKQLSRRAAAAETVIPQPRAGQSVREQRQSSPIATAQRTHTKSMTSDAAEHSVSEHCARDVSISLPSIHSKSTPHKEASNSGSGSGSGDAYSIGITSSLGGGIMTTTAATSIILSDGEVLTNSYSDGEARIGVGGMVGHRHAQAFAVDNNAGAAGTHHEERYHSYSFTEQRGMLIPPVSLSPGFERMEYVPLPRRRDKQDFSSPDEDEDAFVVKSVGELSASAEHWPMLGQSLLGGNDSEESGVSVGQPGAGLFPVISKFDSG
ncbi:hypothetical protein HDU87_007064 [Geranomyces variabilis]|uniref:Uncharacterized protein n=1 Tax=Geranomyces variabilis TaxID=109894 RepID=A0AAD5TEM4_9FUNG|nr:hypothetical protein HDU87_007064 [Geranomyces variabilis]